MGGGSYLLRSFFASSSSPVFQGPEDARVLLFISGRMCWQLASVCVPPTLVQGRAASCGQKVSSTHSPRFLPARGYPPAGRKKGQLKKNARQLGNGRHRLSIHRIGICVIECDHSGFLERKKRKKRHLSGGDERRGWDNSVACAARGSGGGCGVAADGREHARAAASAS